jgi:hypothetical protein
MTEGTMLSDKVSSDDFWWAALSRLAIGEWLSEAQVARLQELGLVERVFGQALLTRLGRTTLGTSD